MQTIKLLAAVFTLTLVSCTENGTSTQESRSSQPNQVSKAKATPAEVSMPKINTSKMTPVTLNIQGMTCGNCSNKLVQKLSTMDGVYVGKIDHMTGNAKIFLKEDVSDTATLITSIKHTITSSGYTVL